MPSKIRILLLTDEMEVGGTQRQIVHIAKALPKDRFLPTVAYFRNRSHLVDELRDGAIPVIEIPKRGRLDPAFVLALRKVIRHGQFDIVHCFAFSGELWGTVACRLLAARSRPVLISSIRNTYEWYSGLQWALKKWVSQQSTYIVANSRAGADYASGRMGLPAGAIEVVYNGVDAPLRAGVTAPALPRTTDSEAQALFVGRLVEQKNLAVLLRAMHRLSQLNFPLHLKIAGDGPLRQFCEQTIDALNLRGCVELLGERSDARRLMEDCDFIILPSLREGLSNVILEAMFASRPVIASAVAGNSELIDHEKNGLLFTSNDDEALALAMARLAGDAPLRQRLGDEGGRRARGRFSVEAMIQTMQNLYTVGAAGRTGMQAHRLDQDPSCRR